MAAENLQLNQALATVDQNKIKHIDLDNTVRWVAQYALQTENDVLNFMFKTGMPGKWPTGEWGFTVSGDCGVIEPPTADPLDHRTSFRYGEIPRYDVKLNSLWGVQAPITIYDKKLRLQLQDPALIKAYHLAAIAKALPKYFAYLSYSIFAGKTNKTKTKPLLRKFSQKYIKPTDGNTNGYSFYRSNGYGEINLQKVINKTKETQHKLDTRLTAINNIIYKDANKVEAKEDQYVAKKKWIKDNLTPESAKTLSVYYKIQEQVRKIISDGCFESKYKVDGDKFKSFDIPTTANDIIIILNKQEWIDLHNDFNFTNLGKAALGTDFFQGVKVLFNDDLDTNTGIIMHKELLQFWILPSETRYNVIPYPNEETTDYVYETMHTLDVVPIYCSMWVEFKSN